MRGRLPGLSHVLEERVRDAKVRPMKTAMAKWIRIFLLVEAAAFLAAAWIHLGFSSLGYEHRQAGIAESVIAAVLLLGLAWSGLRPASTRRAGRVAQGFALFGTIVGMVTIAFGVGPRTVPDIAYHVVILAMLAWGLTVASREPIPVVG